ncbi:MAG: DUF421 domain-containing protein [Clostridiales bacterium]|nr:DUF421 domain-containing protein [Clostridiales bacterium]
MLVVFIKSIIIFFLVFITVRIMGKRELGQMQPHELVITLIIAEVACLPMNDPSIPLYFGIIPVFTLAFLEISIAFLSKKSVFVRKLTAGDSVLVFDKNGINSESLSKLNMSASDLIESISGMGTADIMDVAYVIVETNGKLCIIKKPSQNTQSEVLLPISIIENGKYNDVNLLKTGVEKVNISNFLSSNNINSEKQVLYADVRQDGTIYVAVANRSDISGKVQIKEGVSW